MVGNVTTVAIVASLLVSGTLGLAVSDSIALPELNGPETTPPSNPESGNGPDEYAYPSKPAPLTADTVGPYAVAYERAHLYEWLTVDRGQTITRLDVSCDPSVAEIQSEDGFLVTLECAHSYQGETNGNPYIADGAPYTVSYRIDADTTTRNEPKPVFDSSGPDGDAGGDAPADQPVSSGSDE